MNKARKIMAWMMTVAMAFGMGTTVSAAELMITSQPEDAASAEGSTVIFEVAVEPAENITYQWQQGVLQEKEDGDEKPAYSWTDIPEADGARYEHKVTAADLSGNVLYRCQVSLNGEKVYSESVSVKEADLDSVPADEPGQEPDEITQEGPGAEPEPPEPEQTEPESTILLNGLNDPTGEPSDPSGEPAVQAGGADDPAEEPNVQTEEPTEPTGEPNVQTEEPAEPPEAPKLVSRTDTMLEVEVLQGQQYRIDQNEWQDSGKFEGLTPDTEYEIETRMAGEGEQAPVSDLLKVRTMRAGAGAPELPNLEFAGVDSIEVTAVEGAEYAICEGRAAADQQWNWQTSPVFSGLKVGTEYSIAARIAGTEDQMPGETSEILIASTEKYSADPLARPELISVSDTRIEVKAVSGQVYAIYRGNTMPEGLNWQNSGIFEKLDPATVYRIVTKTPETEDHKESVVSEALAVTTEKSPTEAPEAPKLTNRSQTVLEVEKKTGQEYSIDGGKTWQAGGRFEGLKAETAYEITARIKETPTAAASAASQPLKVSTLRYPIKTSTNENRITGIRNGQIIKVNKNIKFTAEGGGMNIEEPIEGDVRYVPAKWQGLSEGTWKKAPYMATVRAEKNGTYTLKVTFDRQVYKDGKWVSDGEDDIKSIQVKATETGKAAVKTGDETQGMLYLILLAAGAGAAGTAGAVMRKRRRA
ncbi:hypothetical protein H6A65_10870 [Mediterraneibacter glycyrrhizinilyticus]|uniref:hypothetical protein n=1 Tax=Mediterraneibacter glycyrrhizinilyticus TaxID=342942 RepID=UPI0019617350|nr:hypothetical protein [Mediterraneibacter glycyrrhizinilyticus]MBM6751989.1 hypothetical protein [Mediterraneibacter glycyrrhizinilyticus]